MSAIHNDWTKVEVNLTQYTVPILAFQEACSWLSFRADDAWLCTSTKVDDQENYVVTYQIKDPQLAVLFQKHAVLI